MWLKNNVRELIVVIFSITFIVFTAMRFIPIEAFIGVAGVIVTYYFEERSKEGLKKELEGLRSRK